MLENLFSSKILFDVLDCLFKNKEEKLSTAKIIAATSKNQVNVMRSLDKLVVWGFVNKERQGNANVFFLNQKNKYFTALECLFHSHHSSDKRYFLANEEGGVSILAWNYFVNGFSDKRPVWLGILKQVEPSFIYVSNGYGKYFKNKNEWQINAKAAFDRLLDDPGFVREIVMPQSLAKGEKALKILNEIKNKISRLSPPEAAELIDEFDDIISTQICLNHIAVYDLIGNPYSNYLKKYVDGLVRGTEYKTSIVMEKLLAPVKLTYAQLMKKDLLEFALAKRSGGGMEKSSVINVWERWKWLNYGYRGPVFELAYFEQMVMELENKPLNELKDEVSMIETYAKDVAEEKAKIYRNLKIDPKHKAFIEALSDLSYLKVYRKDTAFMLIYLTHEILSKYNNFKKEQLIHNLTLKEAKDLILGRLTITEKELSLREKGSLYGSEDEMVVVGEKARRYLEEKVDDSEDSHDNSLRLLEGMTASLGKTGDWIYGTVRIVNAPEDMAKMNEGDILVSVATTPDILPAMKKAAAIVTDHGGITCHAAIVSRELNIPCLIATKYATKVFKDGDQVVMCPRHSYIKFQ